MSTDTRLAHVAAAATVVEGDVHSRVVERWIDELVIGHGFCPWAKPAGASGHIRVATCTAQTPAGVFEVLVREGGELPPGREVPEKGAATTVVLVCPHVRKWDDFSEFDRFFRRELEGGNVLASSHGLRIVAFHPRYRRRERTSVGDTVENIVGPGGAAISGLVTGVSDGPGDEVVRVNVTASSSPALVGLSLLVTLPDGSADEHWKSLALQAPRPALHLLRCGDLNKAHEEMGERMFTDAIFVRNERLAREFGQEWAECLQQRCEAYGRGEVDVADGEICGQDMRNEGYDILPGELSGLVLWCDMDASVGQSASILAAAGLEVRAYSTPEELLEYYHAHAAHVVGVLSSMMEGGGRKQQGKMNAFGLFARCKSVSSVQGVRCPVMAVISLSADRDAAIAAGADFVVYGNRSRAQQLLVRSLRRRISGNKPPP